MKKHWHNEKLQSLFSDAFRHKAAKPVSFLNTSQKRIFKDMPCGRTSKNHLHAFPCRDYLHTFHSHPLLLP